MEKLIDPDDKVRVAALKFVGGLDVETAGVVGKGVLEAAGERLRDKKVCCSSYFPLCACEADLI